MGQENDAGRDNSTTQSRVVDYLRDAVVELELWRQNARTSEERQALHRVTALLSMASTELRVNGLVPDPAQESLHLTPTASS